MSEERARYDVPGAPNVNKAQDHEDRARTLADALRRYLVGLHTGGITAVLWFAGQAMSAHSAMIREAISTISVPVAVFTTGLIVTGLSIQLAKHREIHRRNATAAGSNEPQWSWFLHSWAWEWLSLALFAAGVLCALVQWEMANGK